jgi:tRNA (guanine37-N1)-methyltransferase
MRFDVITLFPELFPPFQSIGVTRRAFDAGQVQVHLWPLRDFADNAYRRVDDRAYGGGPGMVLLVEPLERALAASRRAQQEAGATQMPVISFSPTGAPLTQARVEGLAKGPGAVLVCGRYEGIDQRFIDRHVDEELSVGDFVLSGGELPALLLLDAVLRLQPGVLHDEASHQQDSFSDGLLDCPHYSRPERLGEALEDAVPASLLSGHHAEIARWRRERQLALTAERRPDLIAKARAAGQLSPADERYLQSMTL